MLFGVLQDQSSLWSSARHAPMADWRAYESQRRCHDIDALTARLLMRAGSELRCSNVAVGLWCPSGCSRSMSPDSCASARDKWSPCRRMDSTPSRAICRAWRRDASRDRMHRKTGYPATLLPCLRCPMRSLLGQQGLAPRPARPTTDSHVV